jgi:hypothetical protein
MLSFKSLTVEEGEAGDAHGVLRTETIEGCSCSERPAPLLPEWMERSDDADNDGDMEELDDDDDEKDDDLVLVVDEVLLHEGITRLFFRCMRGAVAAWSKGLE